MTHGSDNAVQVPESLRVELVQGKHQEEPLRGSGALRARRSDRCVPARAPCAAPLPLACGPTGGSGSDVVPPSHSPKGQIARSRAAVNHEVGVPQPPLTVRCTSQLTATHSRAGVAVMASAKGEVTTE
jgi:hypothetical protein